MTLWLVFSFLFVVAQTKENPVVHVEKNGELLCVYMNSRDYDKLSELEKKSLVKSQANKYDATTIYVISSHRGELWQENSSGNMTIVDTWNKNAVPVLQDNNYKQMPTRSLEHPWFFNVSGALGYNTPSIYFNLYGRYGFYLLKGKWDLAANCLIGYSKSIRPSDSGTKGSFSNSIGVDTRWYFPLKKTNINPFAGLGISYAFGGGNKSFTIPISAGVNIPLWKGCLDACWQYDKVNKSIFMVGYTFIFK